MKGISREIIISAIGGILAIVVIELAQRIWPFIRGQSYDIIQTIILIIILVVVVNNILRTRQIGKAVTFIYPPTSAYPQGRRIQVHRLLQENLTWETMWEGVDKLYDQIDSHTPRITTHTMFLGVNTGGIALSAILADRFGMKPLGIVRTHQGEIDGDIEYLGSIDQIKNIIIVDSEMKTGESAKVVKNRVCEKFEIEEEKVKVAILELCNLDNLASSTTTEYQINTQGRKIQPDFIAYFSREIPRRPHRIK